MQICTDEFPSMTKQSRFRVPCSLTQNCFEKRCIVVKSTTELRQTSFSSSDSHHPLTAKHHPLLRTSPAEPMTRFCNTKNHVWKWSDFSSAHNFKKMADQQQCIFMTTGVYLKNDLILLRQKCLYPNVNPFSQLFAKHNIFFCNNFI